MRGSDRVSDLCGGRASGDPCTGIDLECPAAVRPPSGYRRSAGVLPLRVFRPCCARSGASSDFDADAMLRPMGCGEMSCPCRGRRVFRCLANSTNKLIMKPYISLILSLVATAGVVRAHHGRDFLLLQDCPQEAIRHCHLQLLVSASTNQKLLAQFCDYY